MMVFATDVGSLNWLKTIKIFYVLHKCDYLWGPRLHNHSNLVFHVSRGPLRWRMVTLNEINNNNSIYLPYACLIWFILWKEVSGLLEAYGLFIVQSRPHWSTFTMRLQCLQHLKTFLSMTTLHQGRLNTTIYWDFKAPRVPEFMR